MAKDKAERLYEKMQEAQIARTKAETKKLEAEAAQIVASTKSMYGK